MAIHFTICAVPSLAVLAGKKVRWQKHGTHIVGLDVRMRSLEAIIENGDDDSLAGVAECPRLAHIVRQASVTGMLQSDGGVSGRSPPVVVRPFMGFRAAVRQSNLVSSTRQLVI